MLLPDLIVRTVRDPLTLGNPGEVHRLLDALESLPGRLATTPGAVHALLGVVGCEVRAALHDVRERDGDEELAALVRRLAGLEPDPHAVDALLPPPRRARLDDLAAAETGLDAAVVRDALPTIVPMLLKLLDAGSPVRYGDRSPNLVLQAFLGEVDRCDTDLGEAVRVLAACFGAKRAALG